MDRFNVTSLALRLAIRHGLARLCLAAQEQRPIQMILSGFFICFFKPLEARAAKVKECVMKILNEHALVARVKRKLRPQGLNLYVMRIASPDYVRYGRYVLHDGLVMTGVDLEGIARDLGLLKPYEALVTA